MTLASFFRTARRKQRHEAGFGPALSLNELLAALASGCAPGAGLDALLDRVEGRA